MDRYSQIQNKYIAIGLDKQSYMVSEKSHLMIILELILMKI